MFDGLMKLFERRSEGQRVALGEDELRLASAALLVHAAFVDGTYDEAEEARLRKLLQSHFKLSKAELQSLLLDAQQAEREAVDLYRFTSVISEHLDQDGRQGIVEMLWEVCLADGVIHEFEENLVWRVAELLGVSSRDRIRLRKVVEARH